MTGVPFPVAVVGPGWSGRRLIRTMHRVPGYGLRYLMGRRPGRVTVDGVEHTVTGPQSWRTALADPAVRAVVICVPPCEQVDLATAAVTAGKHVIIEKPVGLSPDRITALRTLARERNRAVAVPFHLACHPLLEHASSVIGRGTIGAPAHASFRMFVHRSRPTRGWLDDPALSGGPFVETLVHGFHLVALLLGPLHLRFAEPVRSGGRVVGGVAIGRHGNGCVTTLETSWIGTDGVRSGHFEIVGSECSVAWDRGYDDDRKHVLRIAGRFSTIAEVGDDDAGFVALLQRFRQACDGQRDAVRAVDLETAETALRLAVQASGDAGTAGPTTGGAP